MNSAKKHGRKNRCSAFEMAHSSTSLHYPEIQF
jgi:hypothetical protein